MLHLTTTVCISVTCLSYTENYTLDTVLYITIVTASVGTTDRNILAMSTVVCAPATVTTAEDVSL